MLVEEVRQCALPTWYRTFEKITFPSEILPLPADVLSYLLEDGQLVLPFECNKENYNGTEDDYEDFGEDEWKKEDEEEAEGQKQPSFPDFSAQVQQVLRAFGGEMFCKLNWSSPKDAAWVAFNNSLKCSSLSHVFLLLKSSDFVAHDLTNPFQYCSDVGDTATTVVEYCLVLRKWMDINPGQEFRCFVRERRLIGICQRDNSSHYEHMATEAASIKSDIFSFHQEYIEHTFPLANYTFDVVRWRKDRVRLVDFNPFGEVTDGIFFTWDELTTNNFSDVEFRYVSDSSGVQPHPYRHYSLPQDFVDLSTGSDPYKLADFLNLKIQSQAGEADSDSD